MHPFEVNLSFAVFVFPLWNFVSFFSEEMITRSDTKKNEEHEDYSVDVTIRRAPSYRFL